MFTRGLPSVPLRAVILKDKQRSDGMFSVFIQFSKDRQVQRINTGILVRWGMVYQNRIIGNDSNAVSKDADLQRLLTHYEKILLTNQDKIANESVKGVKSLLLRRDNPKVDTYTNFATNLIKSLKNGNKTESAKCHQYSLDRTTDFCKGVGPAWSDINQAFLEGLQGHYLKKGFSVKTVAVILRYLRIVYNMAFVQYNTDPLRPVIPLSPFGKGRFVIDAGETVHRFLPLDDIRRIIAYPATGREARARDCWILQLLMLGINAKDLFLVKNSDVSAGRVKFRRHKTGKPYNIKIEPEMEAIIKKYAGRVHLLKFADPPDEIKIHHKTHCRDSREHFKDHTSFRRFINEGMQSLQKKLGINGRHITTYFNRHSFVTLMASARLNIPDDTIAIALTHKSPDKSLRLLDVYRDVDWTRVDKANRKMIDLIYGIKKGATAP